MIKVLQTLFASGNMNRFHGFTWNLCSFTVLTKCDKKGLSCPQYSKCKKLPSGSYDCACMEGFEEFKGEGKLKRCEGKIFFSRL